MKRILSLLLLLPALAFGQGATLPYQGWPPPKSPLFFPTTYAGCTWDSTHDVGPCVNSAIAAAAAVSGGTVMLPCGTFGLATQIENHTSGVHLYGCGTGSNRQTTINNHIFAATRLVWIGSPTANPAVLVQTAIGASETVWSADIWGITSDCQDICDVAMRISGISQSFFNIGGALSRVTNIEFTTPTDMVSPGNQANEIWAYSRDTSTTYSPTGILLDAGCASCTNTSYNNFHTLSVWYNKGDGIVFGDSDNNMVELIRDTPNPGATGSGTVCANSLYTPPSGVPVKNFCRSLRVLHTGSHGMHLTGFQTNSTFTAAGGNAGSAALNPLVINTNATSAQSTTVLNFASTTGAVSGESISCGGPVNGVFNGTIVGGVTSTTITVGLAEFLTTVPSSTACTLTYGISSQAAPGTYTMTATSSTQYTLTAPAGGHTQSGITVAGGVLTFTDMIIPWSGTPTTNDSWTIVVPTPNTKLAIENIDKDNNLPIPTFEAGVDKSYYTKSNTTYPIGVASQCVIANTGGIGGIYGSATGASACIVGSEGGSASGEASIVLGGSGGNASGFATTITGQNNSASGADSLMMGNGASDRGRFATFCSGGTFFAVAGDDQTCIELLKGTGASASAIRLTTNALAATTLNCFNLPNNSAYTLSMDILAFDHTTVTKNASWQNLTALMTRGANAASTALNITSATPAVTYSNGTLTGNAMSITADTTNGCINISWTPPTSNTDTWNLVARIRSIEVQ